MSPGKRPNDTWGQWLSRLLFGTRWTTKTERFFCLLCEHRWKEERPVAGNDATATNLAMIAFSDRERRCPKCASPFFLWVPNLRVDAEEGCS